MFLGLEMVKRIPWPQLFIESVLVIMSVFLALALNNWRQDAFHEEVATQALHTIKAEIRINQSGIKDALTYHESQIAAIDNGSAPAAIALRPAFLQNSAWKTAQAVQAVTYLDYDIASRAAKIHELQEAYQQITQGIIRALYAGSINSKKMNRVILTDLQYIEKQLVMEYDAFLTMTEKQ